MSLWTDFTTFLTHWNQANFDKLVADIQQDIQVAESDLAKAAAWIASQGPTIISDAETLMSVLAALSGNLTIPASVLSVLKVAIADMQQFVGAVSKVAFVSTESMVGVLSAFDSNENPATVTSAYKMHQSLLNATAAARMALATAKKK